MFPVQLFSYLGEVFKEDHSNTEKSSRTTSEHPNISQDINTGNKRPMQHINTAVSTRTYQLLPRLCQCVKSYETRERTPNNRCAQSTVNTSKERSTGSTTRNSSIGFALSSLSARRSRARTPGNNFSLFVKSLISSRSNSEKSSTWAQSVKKDERRRV
jgi:hypothetical protein